MPSTSITWIAKMDSRTCPICKMLHGHTWNFDVKQGIPDALTFKGQVVWNKAIGSQAHGHQIYNCRCQIEGQIHAEDIRQKIQLLASAIEQGAVFEEFSRRGATVAVFRDIKTGRFTRPNR